MPDELPQGAARDARGEASRTISPEAIRVELQRVLESPEFRASRRCQDFLKFVVENTLLGRTEILKERTIGIEAFGRPASYDPSDDATVRVKAGEVRRRLGQYYAGEGREDEIRIELPPGGYVPEFVATPAAPSPEALPPTAPSSAVPRSALAIAMAILALAAGGAAWLSFRPAPSALTEFWAPVIQSASPAMLCAAYVPVYALNSRPGQPSKPSDFTLLNDQFVGGGDLVAASRLSALFVRMHHPYQIRIGNEVSFQDLRTSPAVLIGYSYTRWREISDELRFFIDASRQPAVILDNGKPTAWALPNMGPDRHTNEDFAVVSRVFHLDTHAALIEISGITQYGTEAASELLTNPDLLADALKNVPRDWSRKNLQLVLRVKVISGSPASPRVIASYVW